MSWTGILLSLSSVVSMAITVIYVPDFMKKNNLGLMLPIAVTGILMSVQHLLTIPPEIVLAIGAFITYGVNAFVQDLQFKKLSRWHARGFYPVGASAVAYSYVHYGVQTSMATSIVLFVPAMLFVLVLISPKILKFFPMGDTRMMLGTSAFFHVFPNPAVGLYSFLLFGLLFVLHALLAISILGKDKKAGVPVAPSFMTSAFIVSSLMIGNVIQ